MGRTCSTNWEEKKNARSILVGKPKEMRPLGRPRRTLVDNIKMNVTDRMGWYDWIDMGQDRD
jgi:hypothetical protein